MMVDVTDQPSSAAPDAPAIPADEVRDDQPVVDPVVEPVVDPVVDRSQRPWWRRLDRSVVVVCAIVAAGFVLALNGVLSGVTGDERANLPPVIESVNPVPEAVQVLSQSNVFVDLAPDYTGVLVIDGTEIETRNVDEIGSLRVEPGQQVDLPPVTIYEPGNATLTFTPTDDAPIQEFLEGEHRVQVIYWRIDEGRQRSRSFTWTFSVV